MLTRLFLLSFFLLSFSTASFAVGNQGISLSENVSSNVSFNAENQTFLPVEDAYQLHVELEQDKLLLIWQLTDKYFLYRHGFKNETLIAQQRKKVETLLPKGIEKNDEYFGQTEIYYHDVITSIKLPADSFLLKASSQGCADAGLCYPPYSLYFSIDPATQTVKSITADEYTSPLKRADTATQPSDKPLTTEPTSFLWILISALIGGMILNLMPCVFPVLSIKVMQLARQHDELQAKKQGLAYLTGVIASFVSIASIMLALRAGGDAVGWGFQLQNPWFIASLVYLFFILGLTMSGAITLGQSWMGMGQSLTEKNGLPGAFFTGVLAVIVASPCSAPFMGTALGYAITQSNFTALLIFATLGLGMALPLTVISFIPAFGQRLPKPGLWMERLKEFFAFPLYATAIWLLWVLGNQTSTTGMAIIMLGAIGIAGSFWCFKSPKTVIRISSIILLFASLALPFSENLQPSVKTVTSEHQVFSQADLASLRHEGKAVFIDLTADWCITCIANEKATLHTPEIQQAFEQAGIIYMVGDWTHFNAEITALLSEYNRSGIPLYLLFPPIPDAPAIILPQILTKQIILDSIESMKVSTN